MSIAYFDCYSGVAGDMILGAFIDAGFPVSYLKSQLKLLKLTGYKLALAPPSQQIRGKNVVIKTKDVSHHLDFKEIKRLISVSRLPKDTKEIANCIFYKLAKAEARVHGIPIEKVHFHEVGAIDSIVDIVGAAIGFTYFGFDEVYSSPLPITRGRIKCAHGTMPIPAPATLELLRGVPIEPSPIKEELVTPTGAAVLTTMVKSFGECPIQKIEKIGYGHGDKVFGDMINAVRLIIGEGFPAVVIQANIDDMNPQVYDYLIERLLDTGAQDVDLAAVQMKKNRPAIKLSVLASWHKKDAVINVIMEETTTFGVKYWPVDRKVLTRQLVTKRIKGENIRFKIGMDQDGKIVKTMPEYEDVKKLAKKLKLPMVEILTTIPECFNRR